MQKLAYTILRPLIELWVHQQYFHKTLAFIRVNHEPLNASHPSQLLSSYQKTTHPGKPVLWFVFLCIVQRIVDHAKTCCLATTKVSSEAKDKNHIGRRLVHFCQLFPDFCFGDCGLPRMKNINHLRRNFDKLHESKRRSISSTTARRYSPTASLTLKLTHLSSRKYY